MTPVLQVLSDNIDEGIHVVDKDGLTILYNRQAGLNDGLEPEEVIGRHLLAVFPSLTPHTSTLLKVLATGESIVSQQQTFGNYKGHRVTTVNSTWPIYDRGELVGAIEISKDITRVRELSEQVVDLQAELLSRRRRRAASRNDARFTFDDLLGQAPPFTSVKERAQRAARGDSSILVYGATGTGKELLVHAIHQASRRQAGPFVAQNCAALPEGLLEGLLFGTARGSFTGAEDRPGLLELADGGTLYLDEINSMNQDLQAKLLRVLQDGRFRRLGDNAERKADVRIIASTNEDPQEAIAARRLRQDLYYRINVVYLELPPLRERPDDLDLLTTHFLRKHRGGGRAAGVVRLAPEVARFFQEYDWPGNVRELEHALEAAVQMGSGEYITMADLPPHLQRGSKSLPNRTPDKSLALPSSPRELRSALNVAERTAVERALSQSGGNLSGAARLLGVPRQTLQYRIKLLDIPSGRRKGTSK